MSPKAITTISGCYFPIWNTEIVSALSVSVSSPLGDSAGQNGFI